MNNDNMLLENVIHWGSLRPLITVGRYGLRILSPTYGSILILLQHLAGLYY